MNRNESRLAILLLCVVSGWAGIRGYQQTFVQPVEHRERELRALREKVDSSRLEVRKISAAKRRLNDLAARSLPPDPHQASALYQQWLLETAAACGLRNPVVSPGRSQEDGELDTRLPFSLTAESNTAQLSRFLSRFHRFPLSHRIAGLLVESATADSATGALRISLDIETLVMRSAAPRETLLPGNAEELQPFTLAGTDAATVGRITTRDIFRAGMLGRGQTVTARKPAPQPQPSPVRKPTPPPRRQPDIRPTVTLVGIFEKDQQREAWFDDHRNQRRWLAREGSEFDALGPGCIVLAIERRQVLLQQKGRTWQLELGQNLSQLQPADDLLREQSDQHRLQ